MRLGEGHEIREVDPAGWLAAAEAAKAEGFTMLMSLHATDDSVEAEDFTVDALAMTVEDGPRRVCLRTRVSKAGGSLATLAGVWRAADWHERETYDFYGIFFEGHPDLRRILLPDDWEGHPLRKDYVFPDEYHGISGV